LNNFSKLHKGLGTNFLVAGNRKRNASADEHQQENETAGTAVAKSSANTNPTYVLRAWNLKDVIFIHEECINDTSIVKIVSKNQSEF
jgi:hypothetical protein